MKSLFCVLAAGTFAMVSGANETNSLCTGSSAKLPFDQCQAWIKFFDAASVDASDGCGGFQTKSVRLDPCNCDMSAYGVNDPSPCNAAGTTITHISLRECTMFGSLPDEIGAWVDIEAFDVTKNTLGGKLPLSMRNWTKLRKFLVDLNSFHGGPLPALPFAKFARPRSTPDKFSHLSDCTISDEDHDTYACPWPAGAKDVCMIRSLDVPAPQQHFRLVNDSDCRKSGS